MKKIVTFLCCCFLIISCAPVTKITGSWKNPKQPKGDIKTVFIVALTGKAISKPTLESRMARTLNKEKLNTIKSVDEFAPGFLKDSIPKDVLMTKIKKQAHEAILTISLLKKKTKSHYVKGGYEYNPMTYGYYDNFYGYYTFLSPYIYDPGYYEKEEIYYIETNLYDSQSESLIWSAQSETDTYTGISSFSKKFSKAIANKMKEDGVIK